MPGPQSPAEARVLSKVKVVLNAIADKSRADRWDALARLRLFCEGASSAEELESIGSKKAPTMRTLVEVLEEVGDAAARGSTEEAVLFDIVWLLVRALPPARARASARTRLCFRSRPRSTARRGARRARDMRSPGTSAPPRRSACCAA